MKPTPPLFDETLAEILLAVASVEGFLTPREIRCLVLLGSMATADGEVLEVGSFKGRSTIILAKASVLAGQSRIVAVDPLNSPSITDPDLGGKASGREDFQANLQAAGVQEKVEFHQQRSDELARTWDPRRKIRLLWIDGDHTYRGAKLDFDLFAPFLADGAIVALHDVLHHDGGPTRVFAEDILLSSSFGAAGVSGSIGWGQFLLSPGACRRYRPAKLKLYGQLSRLLTYTAFGGDIEGLAKIGYKLARARIPHGDMEYERWRRAVVFMGAANQEMFPQENPPVAAAV